MRWSIVSCFMLFPQWQKSYVDILMTMRTFSFSQRRPKVRVVSKRSSFVSQKKYIFKSKCTVLVVIWMRVFLPNKTPSFFYLILWLLQVNFPPLHHRQKAVPFWQHSLGGWRWWTVNNDATRQPTWTKKLFFLFFHVWPANLLPQSRFCSHYTPVPLGANILMGLMAHFLWYSNMFSSHTKLSHNSQYISNDFKDSS